MTTATPYFCPECGARDFCSPSNHRFECAACGFHYYHNVAATVSLALLCGAEVMFSRRAREPSKGLLDFPGGFVDPGESLEQALVRELNEELGWSPENFSYLFSFANTYPYAGVMYNTCDAFFTCEVATKPGLIAKDDVEELVWCPLDLVREKDLAFASMVQSVQSLRQLKSIQKEQ